VPRQQSPESLTSSPGTSPTYGDYLRLPDLLVARGEFLEGSNALVPGSHALIVAKTGRRG